MNAKKQYDAIVVGGGPAGLTAGIYLSRSRLNTLIIDSGIIGGQMVLTHEIANYPGVESISGYQLANIMKKQAVSFGCEVLSNTQIADIIFDRELKQVILKNGDVYESLVVILTPGGRPRALNVPGEDSFKGRGISYCATCDGDFFTDKEIAVVGGGNSALEEAVSLTRYAKKVTIIHQFDHFQAFEYAVIEAKSNPKINFIMESVVTSFHGTEKLEAVEIKNVKSGEVTTLSVDGVFIFIGYVPNTEFLKNKIYLNQWGEIVVNSDMMTNIKGVYAAGDSIAKRFRQVTTAVGEGTVAALSAAQYIHQTKKLLTVLQ